MQNKLIHSVQQVVLFIHWESYLFDHLVSGDWAGHAPSLGYDLLDGPKKRLYTNFQVSATLSKKVLIFFL